MFESQYNIYRNRTSRPDNELPKELKNTFVVNFQTGKIDNRIRVRLTPHSVQFIYLSEMDERRGEFGVVVDSISITSPKETGRALLNFGKHSIVPPDISELSFDTSFRETSREIFYNFPCICSEDEEPIYFRYFLKVCLLSFLEEFEMRESVFGISPLYDEVRGKLRQSKVYQLLCSKVKYDMLLYKDMENQCNEQVISDSEYNYVAKRFADLLMDKDLNKIIPPDYYDGEGWFDNPEEELNSVLKHTVKLKKHKTGEGEALKKKICDFFYAKHAIWYAQSTTAEKFFFVMAQISMAAFFIISGISLLCFNVESFGTFADWYFSNFWWIAGGAVVGVLLFLAIIAIFISKSPNVFLPRIIVSVAIMWLVTFVSEDLIKSQIGIFDRGVIIAFAIVLLVIVLVLLIGEIRQHSPYDAFKHLRKWWWKPILLLNSFVFVVGVSGMLMQFVFYRDLLKGSKALSEIVYADYFEELDSYQNQLEALKTSLRDYQQISRSFLLTPEDASGRSRIEISLHTIDTAGNRTFDSRGDYRVTANSRLMSSDNITELNNYSVNAINELVESLKSSFWESYASKSDIGDNCDSSKIDTFLLNLGFQDGNLREIANTNEAQKVVTKNDSLAAKIIMQIGQEQLRVKSNMLENDFETLLDWSTYSNDTIRSDSKSPYLNFIKDYAMNNHKVCRKVGVEKDWVLYPYLLLIHSLIVLILAFVGQLFLNKETVSEPL